MKHLWNYLTIVFVLLLHATVLLGVNQHKSLLSEDTLGVIDVTGVIDAFVGLDYIKKSTVTFALNPPSIGDLAKTFFITSASFFHVAVTLYALPIAIGLCKQNGKGDRSFVVSNLIVLSISNIIHVHARRHLIQSEFPLERIPTITHFSLDKETKKNGDDQYHCKLSYHRYHERGNRCFGLTFPYRDERLERPSRTEGAIVNSPVPCCSNSITEDILYITDPKGNPISTDDTPAVILDDETIVQISRYKPVLQVPCMNIQYRAAISIYGGIKPAHTAQSLYLHNESQPLISKRTQNKLKSFAIVGTTAALMFLGNRNKK